MAYPEKPLHECTTVNIKLCAETKQIVIDKQVEVDLKNGKKIGKAEAIKLIIKESRKILT